MFKKMLGHGPRCQKGPLSKVVLKPLILRALVGSFGATGVYMTVGAIMIKDTRAKIRGEKW